eukprot:PhM_4_TR13026/c0_g2_i1/m.96207
MKSGLFGALFFLTVVLVMTSFTTLTSKLTDSSPAARNSKNYNSNRFLRSTNAIEQQQQQHFYSSCYDVPAPGLYTILLLRAAHSQNDDHQNDAQQQVYCGSNGWMLILAYNNNPNVIGSDRFNNSFDFSPLSSSSPPLVPNTPPLDPVKGYSHFFPCVGNNNKNDKNTCLSLFREVRFECRSDRHDRVTDFVVPFRGDDTEKVINSLNIRRAVLSGESLHCSSHKQTVRWGSLAKKSPHHTAFLPSASQGCLNIVKGRRSFGWENATVFEHMMYDRKSKHHWSIAGVQGTAKRRWECDDLSNDRNKYFSTSHRVWVR